MSDYTLEQRGRHHCDCPDHFCKVCGAAQHAGRLMFRVAVLPRDRKKKTWVETRCGDHATVVGTPLQFQKLGHPDDHKCKPGHAWETPGADGVGTL